MEQENKENTRVIIHKSNWSSQVINVIIVVVLIFLSITNNPTKKDFISQVVSELAKKEGGFGSSFSNAMGDFSANTLGDLIEPFIVRRNFLLFSTYEIDFNNPEVKIHASGYGLWGNIIIEDNPIIKFKERGKLDGYNIEGDNIIAPEAAPTPPLADTAAKYN